MPHTIEVVARAGILLPSLLLLLAVACVSPPRRTAESLRIDANPRATVEGRVTDEAGRPLAGVSVRGIPRGADIPWLPWAVTRCDGTYRLALAAPAHYAFQLLWKERSVITESPRDPARLELALQPGERRTGVDLVLLASLWPEVTGPLWVPPVPPEPASLSPAPSPCP
jgi:hypothetical protein